MFDVHEHSCVSSNPISSLVMDEFFLFIQRNGVKIIFSSLPERNIINDSISVNIVSLEKPWIFDELREI